MDTGEQWSTSYDLNVGADRKKSVGVDFQDMMTQSSSASRGGRMDIKPGGVQMMQREDPSEN